MRFFRTLKGRFTVSHLLPLLITVPLVAIALFYLLETQILLTDMSQNLSIQAQLLTEIVELQTNQDTWRDATQAQTFVTQISDKSIVDELILRMPDGSLLATTEESRAITEDFQLLNSQIQALQAGEVLILINYDLGQQDVQLFAPVHDLNDQLIGIVQLADSLGTISERLSLFGRYVLVVLAIQLLLGGMIGLILALRLERPISRSTTAVIELEQGQYVDPPLRELGTLELKALSHAVNGLSERLRILEETRRRSLANLVHEIGRPLGAIKAAVSVLLGDGADEDPILRQELLTGVAQEVARMQPHLEALTQLHGNVTGDIQLKKQAVNLNQWLPPLLLPWRAAAQEKRITWQTDIAQGLPTLHIDPDKMAQVLGNLLSNAVKYTPQDGMILVTAVSTPTTVQISVQDNGTGIAPNEQKRVFEPFYRSTAQRRFPQGLGLGLSIAHDTVKAHGGSLAYTDNPIGGAIFTITLKNSLQQSAI